MRATTLLIAVSLVGVGSPAAAMTRPMTSSPGFAARAAAVDPGEKLERLAAASTRGDRSHAKPARSIRNVLKDDPYLRAAFAALDNK